MEICTVHHYLVQHIWSDQAPQQDPAEPQCFSGNASKRNRSRVYLDHFRESGLELPLAPMVERWQKTKRLTGHFLNKKKKRHSSRQQFYEKLEKILRNIDSENLVHEVRAPDRVSSSLREVFDYITKEQPLDLLLSLPFTAASRERSSSALKLMKT